MDDRPGRHVASSHDAQLLEATRGQVGPDGVDVPVRQLPLGRDEQLFKQLAAVGQGNQAAAVGVHARAPAEVEVAEVGQVREGEDAAGGEAPGPPKVEDGQGAAGG